MRVGVYHSCTTPQPQKRADFPPYFAFAFDERAAGLEAILCPAALPTPRRDRISDQGRSRTTVNAG
jgi:hypothetical protein